VKKASLSVGEQGGALYVGGIVGYDRGGTIERCVNYQDIDVSISIGNSYVGGITGACSIGTCYYYTSESTDRVATIYGGKLRDCRSEANVSVTTSVNILLGGIVGYHTGQSICSNGQPRIERCCSKGNISGKSLKKATVLVGGACGYILDSEAEDSYSECNVTLDLSDDKSASTAFASGFARIKQNASDIEAPDSIVRNCYAAGTISLSETAANAKSGGFASDLSSNYNSKKPDMVVLYPISEGNYYLSEDPEADASIATPLTADEFAKPESFKTIAGENWDFNDTWYMENGRPRLEAEHTSLYRLIYTSENNRNISVDGVIISKPKADSRLYFAAYSASGKLTDMKSVDITADDCINDEFTEIKLENVFDIPVFSSEVKVFLWTDDIHPAAECKTAAFEAE
jgi:hypothetical protein